MVTVPVFTPVTTPLPVTVAMALLPLLHEPPPTVEVRVPVIAWQITEGPLIVPALAEVLTVTTSMALAMPQLLLTV